MNWTRCIDEFRGQGATYRPTVMSNGQWQLVEVVNKQGDTIGYTAYNKLTKKTDFIVRKNEIQDFMNATPIFIANIVNMGNLTESNPKALNQMQMSVMEGSFSGYLKGWQDGIQDPYFVAFVGSGFIGSGAGSIASRQISQAEIQQMARMSGMLRNVSKNKGNVGMGTATRAEADAMGKAWVGSGYRVSKRDANVFVSSDGMRVYRAPTTKRPSQYNTTGVQANFEQIEIIYDRSKGPIGAKPTEKRSVIVNAHLNIKD